MNKPYYHRDTETQSKARAIDGSADQAGITCGNISDALDVLRCGCSLCLCVSVSLW
jgi:hypothetical protein